MAAKLAKKSKRHLKAQSKKAQVTKQASVKPKNAYRLPSVWRLCVVALKSIWRYKAQFAGIVGIYALLNLLFVGSGQDLASIRDQFASQAVGSLAAYTQLIGTGGSSGDQVTSLYQSILFVMFSLAIIWALRQAYAKEKFRIRDSFYKGMMPLVPVLLVLLVIAVQLIPLSIGVVGYQIVVSSGIADTVLEMILWGFVGLLLVFASLYFVAASTMAFYIATIPDMPPVQALRNARQLVKGRRWTVLRKLLFLPLVLIILTLLVFMPLILLLPELAPWLLLLTGPLLMVVGHSYIFTLYKELVHD